MPPSATPPPNNGGTADGDGPSERVFGTIEYYDNALQATVPATAEVGVPFDVTVTTYGGGCIEKGETTVETEGLEAQVRPYDINTEPANGVCPDIFRTHAHTATGTFTEAGEAEVVFYGLKEDATGTVNVSHTRTLEVVPPPPAPENP